MSIRLRRTKIVTTLGPATDRNNILEKMIAAGVNVVRLNFSHGRAEEHKRRAAEVRRIALEQGKHVAILADLQGPKIRISTFKKGKVFLNVGDPFTLDANLAKEEGDEEKIGIDYKKLPIDVSPGDILLLDDGRVQLEVININEMKIYTTVIVGGELSNNKGINKLGGGLSADALTNKDKADMLIAAEINVDYLAISFPRTGADIHYARKLMEEAGSNVKIVAKIERAEAVASQTAMDEIILASDAIMVARGDLGVEIGDAELVGTQKNLIRRARYLNRIVITATQMMESMINNPMPTRAEVMDVANAVLDGTDAVMLSAETAAGQYPVETVLAMSKVCLGAEKIPSIQHSKHRLECIYESIEEATAMSAMYTANHLKGVSAIIAMTESGWTPLMMSRISSGLPIFALSRHEKTLNLTTLYRGVTPIYHDGQAEGQQAAHDAMYMLKERGFLSVGDLVIITQGDDLRTVGSTNTTRLFVVK